MDKFNEAVKNIDKLISKQHEQIDVLTELKRALIHEQQHRAENADSVISFTKDDLKVFKIAYDVALFEKQKSFMFNDNEFLTGYVKYVIEFMEQKVWPAPQK